MKKLATFLVIVAALSFAAFEIGHAVAWLTDKGNALFCFKVALSGVVLYAVYRYLKLVHWIEFLLAL